uniref:Uncharacterized protein n=1 Tax=Pseudomonas fluorescens (strain SBW25) TaxID=216595 RepID=A0A0G4E4U3_PSEFS|nr:hypothetical protein PQBR57_0241 [Pseudomonas fluorescens SBW25]
MTEARECTALTGILSHKAGKLYQQSAAPQVLVLELRFRPPIAIPKETG